MAAYAALFPCARPDHVAIRLRGDDLSCYIPSILNEDLRGWQYGNGSGRERWITLFIKGCIRPPVSLATAPTFYGKYSARVPSAAECSDAGGLFCADFSPRV